MKQLIALAACLLATGFTFAQAGKTPAKPKKPKTEIEGYVGNHYGIPIPNVQAFVYSDSAMLGTSGYTDRMGHFESGYIGKGKYDLKLVYENGKYLKITGVVIDRTIANVTVKLDQPAADTTLPYTDFAPKPVEKKKKAK